MKRPVSISAAVAADSRRLLRFLAKNRRRLSPLLVLTHDFPDPDSIASALALKFLAEAEGISCRIAFGGVIGRTENRSMVSLLRVPIRRLRPRELSRHENVALVDTQPAFGNNRFPATRRAAIVIDQHRSHVKPNADLSIVNVDCGATSVILATALLAVRQKPPMPVATALAYGILTDTMHFFRTTNPSSSTPTWACSRIPT
jgi:nanoRNase/pAp phosphatase (c-di-AMP/oligoRNAs hydrolase)